MANWHMCHEHLVVRQGTELISKIEIKVTQNEVS